LTVPSWISTWSGRAYENEKFSSGLIVGGGLIVGANLIMQLRLKRSNDIQSVLRVH
jgi:hypothetical protein